MLKFRHRNGELYCEDIPVASLAARHGTPLYVYSRKAFLDSFAELKSAFAAAKPLICYSVKANSNISILRLLARAGSGFDIVSGGELYRALKAGAKPHKLEFAGVGKTADEITAALKAGVHRFNAESEAEVRAIDRVAAGLSLRGSVALRLNPNVDARTHAKTTTARKENKFGIDLHTARAIFAERERYANVDLCGIHVHLGSPIYTVAPYRSAMRKIRAFVREVRSLGADVLTLNVGGGYAISYDGRPTIRPRDYAKVIIPLVKELKVRLSLEPGRFICGNAGILVSRVIYRKQGWLKRRFIVVDAAMNDLLRPALYGATHHIWPVAGQPSPAFNGMRKAAKKKPQQRKYPREKIDVVGPVCESSDCFGQNQELPPLEEGDLVAIYSAGAYGMAMSSTYNSRPRPCEVMVGGSRSRIIRRRETYEDLTRGE